MKRYVFLLVLAVVSACSNDADPTTDQANFTRIYDNNTFNASYFPIDMKQTPDGGYLILGGRRLEDSNFSGIYITKINSRGDYVSDQEVDSDHINPVGQLMDVNGKYYFFCMTSVGLQTELIEMDADGTITQTLSVGGSYPAVATPDNGNFILLSYDNVAKESVLSLVTPAGSISKSMGFSIGAGDAVEEPIINHFIRTGRQLPFAAGKTSAGLYYFNGFYNYTLSLVFTDLSGSNPSGVVQGQQADGGLSQVLPLEGNRFATSRFNFGDNYVLPNTTLNTSGVSSSVDLGGNSFPELVNNAPVKILSVKINGKDVLLYASNTRSRQIALYGYDRSSGEFKGSKYLGFANPFEVASLIQTVDDGLALCGTTYVAGRFPRICIFKLDKEKLSESFGK